MKTQKQKKTLYLFPLGILCGLSLSYFSAEGLEPQGPLALSMSNSGRGAVQAGSEYHLLNPASLIHSHSFSGSAYYIFAQKTETPYWGVSLLENRQIPLAFTYIKQRQSAEQYMNLSTAGFVLAGWSLGLGVSRWTTEEGEHHWNIQSGFLIKPQKAAFSIGFTWDYILELAGEYKGRRKWGLGFAYELYEWLHLRMDTVYNQQKKWSLSGGGKALISQFLILRLASRWEVEDNIFFFSGGIGLTAKHMAIDYSLSQNNHTQDWIHAINVRTQF